jgi:hypothetical protein
VSRSLDSIGEGDNRPPAEQTGADDPQDLAGLGSGCVLIDVDVFTNEIVVIQTIEIVVIQTIENVVITNLCRAPTVIRPRLPAQGPPTTCSAETDADPAAVSAGHIQAATWPAQPSVLTVVYWSHVRERRAAPVSSHGLSTPQTELAACSTAMTIKLGPDAATCQFRSPHAADQR